MTHDFTSDFFDWNIFGIKKIAKKKIINQKKSKLSFLPTNNIYLRKKSFIKFILNISFSIIFWFWSLISNKI